MTQNKWKWVALFLLMASVPLSGESNPSPWRDRLEGYLSYYRTPVASEPAQLSPTAPPSPAVDSPAITVSLKNRLRPEDFIREEEILLRRKFNIPLPPKTSSPTAPGPTGFLLKEERGLYTLYCENTPRTALQQAIARIANRSHRFFFGPDTAENERLITAHFHRLPLPELWDAIRVGSR